MEPLENIQWIDQTKPFVGRQKELKLISHWLNDPQAMLQIFYLSGMGGMGKSTLMTEMMLVAKQSNVTCIWLDGRACTQTPVEFIEYLSSTLRLELWNRECSRPLDLLLSANDEQRFLLCIDNFEHLSLLEGWIMNVFLPKLPLAGIAIVLASRSALSPMWKLNRSWGKYIIELPLTHFSFEESIAYIQSLGTIEAKLSGELVRVSNGHPLALAMVAEAVQKKKELSVSDKKLVSQEISASLMRELTFSELHPMTDALVVLLHANQELLSRFLEQKVTIDQYRSLQNMSFIKTEPDGLTLHDLARMYLLRDLRLREPQRLDALQAKAMGFLYRELHSVEQSRRREIASRMLILSKDSLQLDQMYANLSIESHQSTLESIKIDDLPYLHQLLDKWCEYSVDAWQIPLYHQCLDELAEQFPESIAILRDTDGLPIAMFIAVLLHEKTSKLLNKFFALKLAECCDSEELQCDPNNADTYYAVLGAATSEHSVFSREELVGMLTLDRLSLLGEGARVVLIATNSNLKRFLQQLGFTIRPTISRDWDTLYEQADVLELDLRNDGFGDWIMSIFPTPLAPYQSSKGMSEKEVRKLLTLLHNPIELQAFVHYFQGVQDGAELQNQLLELLADKSSGLSEQDRQLLKYTYDVYPGNTVLAASSCNMSRATYYRHLRTALSNFTKLLHRSNKAN